MMNVHQVGSMRALNANEDLLSVQTHERHQTIQSQDERNSSIATEISKAPYSKPGHLACSPPGAICRCD